MKTVVYFVRHAEPDISIRDDRSRPLTDKGMEDARKVTGILADKGISAVYSSPYKRTVDTIKDFAGHCGLEIKTNHSFRERSNGAWVEDFRTYAQNQWEDFSFKLEGGECLREVQERNISALFDVLKENIGRTVAIAIHGTALSTIINYYNPDYGFANFWAIAGKMPYILCCSFDGQKLESIEEIEIIQG